jgi:hypothetical protein
VGKATRQKTPTKSCSFFDFDRRPRIIQLARTSRYLPLNANQQQWETSTPNLCLTNSTRTMMGRAFSVYFASRAPEEPH